MLNEMVEVVPVVDGVDVEEPTTVINEDLTGIDGENVEVPELAVDGESETTPSPAESNNENATGESDTSTGNNASDNTSGGNNSSSGNTDNSNNGGSNNSGGNAGYTGDAKYVGVFSIPSLGVSVNCYASAAQSVVDAQNAAAYFYLQGHLIIADHVNQGFHKIKSCSKGTVAYAPNGTKYECVAVMNGINTGYSLTTTDGTSIKELYPGTLVAYTCNSNWQSVTMVFFKVYGTSLEEPPEEYAGEDDDFYASNDPDLVPCPAGTHQWVLLDSFQYYYIDDDGSRVKVLREVFECSVCKGEWYKTTKVDEEEAPTEPEQPEDDEQEVSPEEPTTPPTEPPTEETIPPVEEQPTESPNEPSVPEETQPENTEPPVEETTPSEPETTPTEPPTEPPIQEQTPEQEPPVETEPVSPPQETPPPAETVPPEGNAPAQESNESAITERVSESSEN